MHTILAVDIGGTKLALGVGDAAQFAATGKLGRVVKEPIPGSGAPEIVIARVLELAGQLARDSANGGPIGAIGISIGGPLDHRSGTVVNFPHLPGWRNIPLRALLSEGLEAPALLDNDANLGALAEHRFGAGRGMSSMVYLTISTGIGGGVIVDGRLVHGVGSGAGEVGHITVAPHGPRCACGNRGCLEMMASGTAIARRARESAVAEPLAADWLLTRAGAAARTITTEMVAEGVRLRDPFCGRLWEETAEYIAIGLGAIVHVLAPEVIVLGGGVAQTGELLLEPVRRRLRDHVFYVPLEMIAVRGAMLGHDSALLGAAALALEAA